MVWEEQESAFVSRWGERGFARTGSEDVLEADIEGRISVGCECISVLARDVFWSAIIVAHRIPDLYTRAGQLDLRYSETSAGYKY